MEVNPISRAQSRFAATLALTVLAAMIVLTLAFVAYATGILPSATPPVEVVRYWDLKAGDYLAATGQSAGWTWLARLPDGEACVKAALALIAAAILVCYAVAASVFAREGNRLYTTLTLLQIVIFVVAASGLGGGGH